MQAAIERMRYPATNPYTSQTFQYPIDRAPDMQQNGQIEITSDLQLLKKKKLLAVNILLGQEVVETNLTDGNRRKRSLQLGADPRPQGIKNGIIDPLNVKRVYAVSRKTVWIPTAAVAHGNPVLRADGRNDGRPDAGGTRGKHQDIAIAVKFVRIQMAMRVDQHFWPINPG